MNKRNCTILAGAGAAFLGLCTLAHAGAPCIGDTNGDNVVDVNDLINVIVDWETDGSGNGGDVSGPGPDTPPDGIVDINDLVTVIVKWGHCP